MSDSDDFDIKSPVVRRFMKRWKLAADAESDNRKRGLYALKFAQGGDEQWESKTLGFRRDDNRPCESYNQIPNFIHQITNDARMNMPQTRFVPNEDADKEQAEVREDLVRSIQAESDAEIAYDTALYNACVVGWGYWRYTTDYTSPDSFDQKICVTKIDNSFTVYDDPYAVAPGHLDRKWLIQVCDVDKDDFNSDYDKDYDESTLQSIGDNYPEWATAKTVRVAEGWEVTEKKSMLYRNKKTGTITKTKPKDMNNYDAREVMDPKVTWYKFTGDDLLETKEWQGKYIPYVFIAGEEINIDGQMKRYGIVERMIPAQRLTNYSTNATVELAMLAPKTPAIADPEAIGPYQKFWDQANVRAFPYLPYKSRDAQGNPLPMPQRLQNSADIASFVQLGQMGQEAFYNLSGIFPASLGKQGNESSGKAINARQKEGDVSNFHIDDNCARGLRAGGRILDDLIPIIYDGSRNVSLMKEDKTSRIVKINQPYTDESGQQKMHDMTKGTYNVMVTTGPSFTTKRQEAAESMTQIIQAAPQLMEVAGDLLIGSMDWPGADKLAERLKKLLPPALQDQPNQQQIPPQVQQQMQQMQQALEQMSQELQKAQHELQSKQADIATKGADIELKQQQMAANANSDQMKTEISQLQIELDREKIQLERDKMMFEERKMRATQALDLTKSRIDAKAAMAQSSPDMAMTDPDLNEGTPPVVGIMTQLSALIQQSSDQISTMTVSSQAIAQSNMELAQSNQQIAAAIAAPKTVIRQNGLITGVK